MSSALAQLTPEQLANLPAAPASPGQVSNLVDPLSISHIGITITAVFLALSSATVLLRLYTRAAILKAFGIDDWLIIGAAVVNIAQNAIGIKAYSAGGMGTHIWDTPAIDLINPAYTARLVATSFLYPLASCLIKISILLLLRRVFAANVSAKLSLLINVAIGLVVVVTVIFISMFGAWCVPRLQDHNQLPPTCTAHGVPLTVFAAAFYAMLDLYIFILPLKNIWELNTSRRRKVGIITVLATGLLACICSLLNIYFRVSVLHTVDATWDYVPALVTGGLEVSIGIITASIPCLPAFWKYVKSRGKASTAKYSTPKKNSNGRHPREEQEEMKRPIGQVSMVV